MARPAHVRDAVRTLVGGSLRHDWCVELVADGLRAGGLTANASSIYRALADLEVEGVLVRLDLGDGKQRFERADLGHHDHVRCATCGAVAGLPCRLHAGGVDEASGFRLLGHRLVVQGVCPECQEARA